MLLMLTPSILKVDCNMSCIKLCSCSLPQIFNLFIAVIQLFVATLLASHSCIIIMKARAKVIVSYTIMGTVHKPCLRPSTQQVIQKNWASTSTKIGIVVSCSTWKVQCIIVQKFNVEGIDTYSYTVVLGKKRQPQEST